MRTVHARMLRETMQVLSSDRLRDEVAVMQQQISGSLLKLGAKKAFLALHDRLRLLLDQARKQCHEIHDMLAASFQQLNSEFGFALTPAKAPSLERYVRDLDLIARNYSQYLGLSQALRLSDPRFMEQFRRMLLSKLRVTFENASGEIELWNKSASAQVDSQLRERRRGFKRRREALERIQTAAVELEQRIGELESQDTRDQQVLARVQQLLANVRERVEAPILGEVDVDVLIDAPPVAPARRA
jgi:hypothetical protein